MAANLKDNKQRIVLVVVMVVLAFLLARQYLPMIKLPTTGRIQEEMKTLASAKTDLAVQQKMNDDWRTSLGKLQAKTTEFWMRQRTGVPIEQEVSDEFKNVTRLAGVNIQKTSARLQKTPSANFVQEVEVEVQLSNASMREFSRLLRELKSHKRKFYWTYCKIDPDNQQNPTSVRINGRLRAYVLNDDAKRILENGVSDTPVAKTTAKPAGRPNAAPATQRKATPARKATPVKGKEAGK
jgi:hypothetical protein